MDKKTEHLTKLFINAATRHDDMLATYGRAAPQLFNELSEAVKIYHIPGTLGGKNLLFNVGKESASGVNALIVKSNRTNKNHAIGQNTITFQTSGLGYHPSDGRLCGFIDVILSNGDYWRQIKGAKISFTKWMTVGMISQSMLSNMKAKRRYQLEAVDDIWREVIDLIWMTADEPGKWFRLDIDRNEQELVVQDYIPRLLDHVFNPERKEWVYKDMESTG